MEKAEIMSIEKPENRYFLVLRSKAKLRIADEYEILKKERQDAILKFSNLDLSEANIKAIREAKNSLVKLRTGITGGKDAIDKADKDKIKAVFKEVSDELENKILNLVDMTQPRELVLAKIVSDFDDKLKKEIERKAAEDQKRKDEIQDEIKKFVENCEASIKGLTNDDSFSIELPDYDFQEYYPQVIIEKKRLVEAYNAKKKILADQADFEKQKAELKAAQDKLEADKKELAKKQAETTSETRSQTEALYDPKHILSKTEDVAPAAIAYYIPNPFVKPAEAPAVSSGKPAGFVPESKDPAGYDKKGVLTLLENISLDMKTICQLSTLPEAIYLKANNIYRLLTELEAEISK